MKASVLAVTSQLPWPLDRGGHLRSFYLLKALAERYRVLLIAGVTEELDPPLNALQEAGINVSAVQVPTPRWPREALRVARCYVLGQPYAMYGRHLHRAMRSAISRAVQQEPLSVMYYDHLDSFQFHALAVGVPFVLDLHNVYSTLVQRAGREKRSALQRRVYESQATLLARMERRAASAGGVLVTVSPDDQSHFERLGARDVRVVPNGVECAKYDHLPSGRHSGSAIILFTGSLSWPPNVTAATTLASRVLPLVKQSVPEARLQLVGRSPSPAILDLARLPGVEVLADVPDMEPYLRSASVLAVPLTAGGGSRLKILEAFAAGLPVVSTPVGAEGIGAVNGTHLLLEDNERFAQAVTYLLQNPDTGAGLAIAARALVRQFDWRTVGSAMCAAVDAALSTGALGRAV